MYLYLCIMNIVQHDGGRSECYRFFNYRYILIKQQLLSKNNREVNII